MKNTLLRPFSLLLAASLAFVAPAQAGPSLVFDVASGTVTHAEEASRRWSPASLTKLMTAYVTFKALDEGNLTMQSPVRMTEAAISQPPSKMGYGLNSVMTVDNALKMVIIRSANDVSVALGEAVAGSPEAFVERMNAEAAALGMTQTNFVNPHGLHDDNQYSTARDIALLARAIRQQYPQHNGYFSAEGIRTGETVTASYNLLLGRYAGADGMKTGFVCASGFNLVASATRDGNTLVSVVMGAPDQKSRAETSAVLLEDGFARIAGTTGTDTTTLDAMTPDPAETALPPANLREEICSEEARAARWEGRAVEGFMTFDTPAIATLERPPRAVAAGLGGAEGQSASAIVLNGTVIDGYPIPADKPERPSLVDAEDLERYGLRPGFAVPVPGTRPAERGQG